MTSQPKKKLNGTAVTPFYSISEKECWGTVKIHNIQFTEAQMDILRTITYFTLNKANNEDFTENMIQNINNLYHILNSTADQEIVFAPLEEYQMDETENNGPEEVQVYNPH